MEWLKGIRREKGLTQAEVSERAGIAQPSYSSIECGAKRPGVDTAKKIASILGFDWTKFYE